MNGGACQICHPCARASSIFALQHRPLESAEIPTSPWMLRQGILDTVESGEFPLSRDMSLELLGCSVVRLEDGSCRRPRRAQPTTSDRHTVSICPPTIAFRHGLLWSASLPNSDNYNQPPHFPEAKNGESTHTIWFAGFVPRLFDTSVFVSFVSIASSSSEGYHSLS